MLVRHIGTARNEQELSDLMILGYAFIKKLSKQLTFFDHEQSGNILHLDKTEFIGVYYGFLYELISKLMIKIGFDKVKNNFLLDFVIMRIFEPASKLRSIELLEEYFGIKNDGTILGKKYFEEQLHRIREIRLSERKFYQKITDIYSTAVDYDVTATATKRFFATVQNKLHWAIHGNTAAEVIVNRADHQKENMGLTTWKDAPKGKIQKFDIKDYFRVNFLNCFLITKRITP